MEEVDKRSNIPGTPGSVGDWVDQREEEGIHCIICDKLCKNAYGLANHVTKTHRMSFSEYKRRVFDAAVREIGTLKAFAGEEDKIGQDFFERECKNTQHLFILLKGEWVNMAEEEEGS